MKLIREAVDNRNAKGEENCAILQPLGRILILECPPGEERENQKYRRMTKFVRAEEEFECGDLREG